MRSSPRLPCAGSNVRVFSVGMLLKWGLSVSLTPCACDFSPRWRPTWERGFPRLYELTTRQVLHQQAPHHVPVKKDKLVSKGPRRAGHREPGEGKTFGKNDFPPMPAPVGQGCIRGCAPLCWPRARPAPLCSATDWPYPAPWTDIQFVVPRSAPTFGKAAFTRHYPLQLPPFLRSFLEPTANQSPLNQQLSLTTSPPWPSR